MRKKLLLANFFFRTRLLKIAQRLDSKSFVVFNYHRIRPDISDFMPLFDSGVYGPSATEFDEQVAWLSRNTCLLSEAEGIAHVEGKSAVPPRGAMITFDDGYRDNYTLALPILKYHRARLFFSSQHSDRGETAWMVGCNCLPDKADDSVFH